MRPRIVVGNILAGVVEDLLARREARRATDCDHTRLLIELEQRSLRAKQLRAARWAIDLDLAVKMPQDEENHTIEHDGWRGPLAGVAMRMREPGHPEDLRLVF